MFKPVNVNNRVAVDVPRLFGARQFALLTALYICWAAIFVWRTSTIGVDGHRYFALFDDGMISMRYARHLAEGLGPVWNVGQAVEGYSNPLWVAVMSLAVLLAGTRYAPLLIQIVGLIFVVLSAHTIRASVSMVTAAELPISYQRLAGFGAGALVYAYYPISFWALDGMEVSALTIIVAISVWLTARDSLGRQAYACPWLVALSTLAYFLRPDGFLQLTPLLLLSAWLMLERHEFRSMKITAAVAIVAVTLVSIHLLWRRNYYGELLPNTYMLKMQGYSLSLRLRNGLAFIAPYLLQTGPGFIAASLASIGLLPKSRVMLIGWGAVPLVAISYQIYVGGDPFLVWRQLTPAFVAVAALCGCGIAAAAHAGRMRWPDRRSGVFAVVAGAALAFVTCIDVRFATQIVGMIVPYNVQRTHDQVRRALAWRQIAGPNATALLFNAGTLPYFWDGKAYDALGKMDATIAKFKPDLSVAWDGMQGVPGHAKFDLNYSLATLKPDYVEKWVWFSQDMSGLVSTDYAAVTLREGGDVVLCVRKGSPNINWETVKTLGQCDSSAEAL
jgi:hypothetical protein